MISHLLRCTARAAKLYARPDPDSRERRYVPSRASCVRQGLRVKLCRAGEACAARLEHASRAEVFPPLAARGPGATPFIGKSTTQFDQKRVSRKSAWSRVGPTTCGPAGFCTRQVHPHFGWQKLVKSGSSWGVSGAVWRP